MEQYDQKRRYLVIARVGDTSLHKQWLLPPESKNFDLYLEYFGDGSHDYTNDCQYYSEAKATKWPRIYEIIKQNREQIEQYDAIWIPDDDLSTDSLSIMQMFTLFTKYNLSLAQPALTLDSYFSHNMTLRSRKSILRYTQFVEVMAPIFSREALLLCWDSFQKSHSGWGLDSAWPKILGYPDKKIAIIDEVPMKHTRPVGEGTLYRDIQTSPYDELENLCKEYDVTLPLVFHIYGRELKQLDD